MIKIAMVELDAKIREKNLKGSMILQVHDELVFEVPQDQASHFAMALKDVMEKVMTLEVPLVVEFGIGDNWDAAHA